MGLFDWLRRKDAGDPSSTTYSVTSRDVSVDVQDPQQRAALEQADHLIHDLLAGGAGQGSAGGLTVTASTQVFVDGQMVTPDDPRALEGMSRAAAKLREQGLEELAADLEARVAAAPAAAPGSPPRGASAPGEDDQSLAAAGADDELGAAPNAPAPPEPPAPPS